ncbi:ArnT family glycosyltransferase [Allorhodopirellula solitaria]|uniref:ArnT family glycosyltransferase n=1 Tax=Allorhodopirellula solitaria TaxID=2527987 RepID=UPI001FEB06BA|nr:glycosyltransferase family 39 protein [Allorhodopirellula solitaria]
MNGRTRIRLAQCICLVAAVLIVRGGFLFSHQDSLHEDPDAYRVIAQTLAKTDVFGLPVGMDGARPTAFRPPLYPWLLSWLVDDSGTLSNSSVAIFHWILGGLTVVFTWDIARRLLSNGAAAIAAGLVLIDPILLWQSSLVMTETIATALAVSVWWWIARHTQPAVDDQGQPTPRRAYLLNAFVLGTLLALCILCRPTFLVWAMLVLPVLALMGEVCRYRRATAIAMSVAVIVAGVGAWTVRNVGAIGHPVWGTTHGGYTLLLANNDSFYDYLEDRPYELPWRRHAWEPAVFFAEYQELPRSGDEWADDQLAYAAAKTTIAERPRMFLYSCWVRLTRLWQPFPHAVDGRSPFLIIVVGLLHCVVYALILIAGLRHVHQFHPHRWRRWVAWWPAVAILITLSGVHTVYWSNSRMRSPAIPALSIAAAAAFVGRKNPSPVSVGRSG